MLQKVQRFLVAAIVLATAACAFRPSAVKRMSSTKSEFYNVDIAKIFSVDNGTLLRLRAEPRFSFPRNLSFPTLDGKVESTNVTVSVVNAPLRAVLAAVRVQTGVPIVVKEDVDDYLVTLKYRGPLLGMLRYVSVQFDLWVYEEDGVVVVRRYADCYAWIPTFLTNQRGKMSSSDVAVSAEPNDVLHEIADEAKSVKIQIVALSGATGMVHFRAPPEEAVNFKKFIAMEVKKASRFVLVKIGVFQLTLESHKAFEFSFSNFWKAAGIAAGGKVVLSTGSKEVPEGQSQLSMVVSGTKRLKTFFNYLAHYGRLEVVSTPTVMTASGVPAEFSITKEVGWWEPGDLVETYGVAGDQTSRLRQERPIWKEKDVGLVVVVRPKVVNDNQVLLDFYFEDSNVYQESTFDWQAYPKIPPIKLTKPLVATRKLLNRTVLHRGEFLLVAGIRTSTSNRALDVWGKNKQKNDQYLLIVLMPVF